MIPVTLPWQEECNWCDWGKWLILEMWKNLFIYYELMQCCIDEDRNVVSYSESALAYDLNVQATENWSDWTGSLQGVVKLSKSNHDRSLASSMPEALRFCACSSCRFRFRKATFLSRCGMKGHLRDVYTGDIKSPRYRWHIIWFSPFTTARNKRKCACIEQWAAGGLGCSVQWPLIQWSHRAPGMPCTSCHCRVLLQRPCARPGKNACNHLFTLLVDGVKTYDLWCERPTHWPLQRLLQLWRIVEMILPCLSPVVCRIQSTMMIMSRQV